MTATYYEIPLTPNGQIFYASIAGVTYRLRVVWRENQFGGWFLDILDSNEVDIVTGIPLATGVDLLEQYPDKAFGFGLYVYTDGAADAVPIYENLGTQAHLVAKVVT